MQNNELEYVPKDYLIKDTFIDNFDNKNFIDSRVLILLPQSDPMAKILNLAQNSYENLVGQIKWNLNIDLKKNQLANDSKIQDNLKWELKRENNVIKNTQSWIGPKFKKPSHLESE